MFLCCCCNALQALLVTHFFARRAWRLHSDQISPDQSHLDWSALLQTFCDVLNISPPVTKLHCVANVWKMLCHVLFSCNFDLLCNIESIITDKFENLTWSRLVFSQPWYAPEVMSVKLKLGLTQVLKIKLISFNFFLHHQIAVPATSPSPQGSHLYLSSEN